MAATLESYPDSDRDCRSAAPRPESVVQSLSNVNSVSSGEHFELRPVLDSRSFTAAVVNDKNQAVLFTEHGIVKN